MALTKTPVAMIDATGTAGSGNFLRGDGTWSTPASGITAMTAVASTSGTAIDFTSIPTGVKRITVMFSGVSTVSTSNVQIQLGTSSGIENTGYSGQAAIILGTNSTAILSSVTSGVPIYANLAADIRSGAITFSNLNGNTWVASGTISSGADGMCMVGYTKTLSAVLDRVRITTLTGTEAFDAGSINVLYE